MHKLHPLNPDGIRADLARVGRASGALRCSHRLHAVLLVSAGHSCYQVAHWLGDAARSVERWVHAYEDLGLQGLGPHPGAGRPPRLTPAQHLQLDRDLGQPPSATGLAQGRWTGKLLARHLEGHFGVLLSQRQCQRLLRRYRP